MKTPLFAKPAGAVPARHACRFLLATLLCSGLALSGCTRFEPDAAKNSAQSTLKQPSLPGQTCSPARPQTGLVGLLDETLAKTKEAKAWPVSKSDRCKHQFPYHFTVISVSPVLVIGTPLTSPAKANCVSGNASIHCLRSERFAGRYEVADTFTHASGLVWFSPEHGPRLFDIPQHAKSMYLLINGKSLRLKRKGNQWVFAHKR